MMGTQVRLNFDCPKKEGTMKLSRRASPLCQPWARMVFIIAALSTVTVPRIAVKNRVAELEISMRSAAVEADEIFED
jgi:hypothetical protein